jgi:hypothetical protein
MAEDESGLVKRGFALLGAMTLLVTVVLFIVFQSPRPTGVKEKPATPVSPTMLALPLQAFPASIDWAQLYQFGDALPSAEGFQIRYTAASVQARLGSRETVWPQLREMLDEDRQKRNFRMKSPDGRDVPELAEARLTVVSALKALAEWHDKQTVKSAETVPAGLKAIYPVVDKLCESDTKEIREQAEKTRKTFFRS